MTTSSEILDVPLERPIAQSHIEMLARVSAVSAELNFDYVVAGATARDIILWNIYGIKEERATADVDVAVCALSWDHFDKAVNALVATGYFEKGQAPHNLSFKVDGAKFAVPLDVIPFGPLEKPKGEISWPPDGQTTMGVLGFEEAIRTAAKVRIGPNVVIPVVTPPALVMLKVMAWTERGARKNTDAPDILHIARNYEMILGPALWEADGATLMEKREYKAELAAAELLGQQSRAIANIETRRAIENAMSDDKTFEGFVRAALRPSGIPLETNSFESRTSILEALRCGLLGQ